MTADERVVLVANPYKAALGGVITRVETVVGLADGVFDAPVKGMRGKAWDSPSGDVFFGILTTQARAVHTAGQDCLAALHRAHQAQPDQVDPDSWQARHQGRG
jgi:hypothetical protein